jgi:hypothetical protein
VAVVALHPGQDKDSTLAVVLRRHPGLSVQPARWAQAASRKPKLPVTTTASQAPFQFAIY